MWILFSNHTKDIINIIKDIEISNKIKIPEFEKDHHKKVDDNNGWELVDLIPQEMFKK